MTRARTDYVNCPMNQEEYDAFWKELTTAQEAEVHGFEDSMVFEGCMPVEVMARRGHDTLLLRSPEVPGTGRSPDRAGEPYAVVQLRRDNAEGTVYNLVGFQTHLKFPEQRRVFSMIPALRNAEFLRYGVMHRNTFLDSPRLLDRYYRLKKEPRICLCRADDRRGGLRGVRCQRLPGGHGDGPAPEGSVPCGFSPGNGHRRAGTVHFQRDL